MRSLSLRYFKNIVIVEKRISNVKKKKMNWNDLLKIIEDRPTPPRRVEKTDEEWKRLLTPEQYRVARQHGT